jgi:hypothetical protein
MHLINQKFSLGTIVMTPTVEQTVRDNNDTEDAATLQLSAMFVAHASGNWGDIDDEDKKVNDEAVKHGRRIISAYAIDLDGERKGWGDNCVWLITEADRSVTTALLPSEY